MINYKKRSLIIVLCYLSAFASLQAQRPNIIVIVVDDMRFDEWSGGGHPFLKTPAIDQLAKDGTQFTRAYHTIPLCSPNRASILTGQFPSRHGIIDNTSRNQASFMLDLFPKYLQRAGYKTAHVGKWHMGNSSMPRPGYDYWLCMEGQGKTYDPVLYEGDQQMQYEGYITDIFTEKSIDFIKTATNEPFFLYIGHKAVHPEAVQKDDGTTDLSVPKEFMPAERHKGIYAGEVYKRSISHSPDGSADSDKPVIENALKIRTETIQQDSLWLPAIDIGVSDKSISNRAEMILSVDESLEKIVATLKELGIEDNTAIIFTSDNGYFFGEHGLSLERRLPYEESIKAPLIIKHPSIVKPIAKVDGLVLSIDIAATALQMANIEIPNTIQGESLLPLIAGELSEIRPAAFVEYYSHENPFPWTAQLDYRVVVDTQYKYIKWLRFDNAELYDLKKDPFELKNLIDDQAYSDVLVRMKAQMADLQLKALGLE